MPQELSIIAKPYLPTITLWNRLEGRPRTQNFERALKAEVRDALWMLSKQWQTGEFQGEDAASALLAKVHIKTTALTKYQAGEAAAIPFSDLDIPLEVKVEHQEIPFAIGGQEISLDLRLTMGRHWLKLLKKNVLDSLKNNFLTAYKIDQPDPLNPQHAHLCAHIEVWQQFSAASVGNIDGYKLYLEIKNSAITTNTFSDLIAATPALTALGEKYVKWFEKLFLQPENATNPSWKPSYLEYQFNCSAPKGNDEKVLVADEYYHGHLDWYNLDIHDKKSALGLTGDEQNEAVNVENKYTLSFIPSPIKFPGMPHSRWWQMENWKTDIGKLSPDTTDINQLMLMDFGLNYANDWMILPFTLPVGSIANIEGLMVTNTFGEKLWLSAAGKGGDEQWNRWSMFHLNTRGDYDVPQDLSLVLMPAAAKVHEGKPLEEVYLLRDEVANMVWGMEHSIPLATGKSKRGKEAGIEYRTKLESFIEKENLAGNLENEAKIRYQIVNFVPEQWIPFIPVHKGDDKREIQLQRAAMPRIFDGDKNIPKKVEPRTTILRSGLDAAKAYFIHEEEVPRAGILVKRSFQRTRWYNGKVCTWIGFRKQIGKGEGHNGLAFDQLISPK
jgi:hypothetical protein